MLARAMDASAGLRALNRGMVVFDLCLGTGAIAAPDATLRALGHDPRTATPASCSAAAGRSG
jgi:hypothetical protein